MGHQRGPWRSEAKPARERLRGERRGQCRGWGRGAGWESRGRGQRAGDREGQSGANEHGGGSREETELPEQPPLGVVVLEAWV